MTLPNPVELRRLDPARNMFRFYLLAIEPGLFGGFRLLRQWGRIGARGGPIKIAHYPNCALAAGDFAMSGRTQAAARLWATLHYEQVDGR